MESRLKTIKTALTNLIDVAVKVGLVEKINPPGKPLAKLTKVPVTDADMTVAIADWDDSTKETGCPVDILDAKQKGK